jgi:hypothetical protein
VKLRKLILSLTIAASWKCARADAPVVLFEPLTVPLSLPPGLVETLPLNKTASFYGDVMRIVDCTDDADAVNGICGNQLFGGDLLTDSHLSGDITIQFSPPAGNIAHFVVFQGSLRGDDTVLAGPLGYSFPLLNNQVSDALQLSSGDLDLTTGVASNLQWHALFNNSGLQAIGRANPNLALLPVAFPGARGHAYATFAQRPDGLLDFYFRGSTFLPLGKDVGGDPVHFPLPYCDSTVDCPSVLARGSSLHPHLYLDTRESLGFPDCGSNCPVFQENHQSVFMIAGRYTAFGDDFDLDIPQLYCPPTAPSTFSSPCAVNGTAAGRAELQGRLQIQFGPRTGNTLPFRITSLRPSGLFANPPVSPQLGPGFQPGLLGTNQLLSFPYVQYFQSKLSFADEPFNVPQGMIDLSTGRIIGEFEYPMFIDQTIIESVVDQNNGRVENEPFFVIASRPAPGQPQDLYALFEKGQSGETTFRFSGLHKRSYATYIFPNPDMIPGHGFLSGSTGNLNIFDRLQASHPDSPPASISKSGSGTFTSPAGDTFAYNFTIPCNPAGQSASFVYTNKGDGQSSPYTTNDKARAGTFTLKSLVSATCTNSHASTAAPGDYDIVNFTGFGTWSQDKSDSLHRFVTVSASVDPANPYAAIIVFRYKPTSGSPLFNYNLDVELSSAENKPADKPVP